MNGYKLRFCVLFFSRHGTSGEKNYIDILCVLPLNMVNQKFYTFFCFWLAFLLVSSIMTLTIRVALIVSAEFREIVINTTYGVKRVKVCTIIWWGLTLILTIFKKGMVCRF
jgi:hypothetical protein